MSLRYRKPAGRESPNADPGLNLPGMVDSTEGAGAQRQGTAHQDDERLHREVDTLFDSLIDSPGVDKVDRLLARFEHSRASDVQTLVEELKGDDSDGDESDSDSRMGVMIAQERDEAEDSDDEPAAFAEYSEHNAEQRARLQHKLVQQKRKIEAQKKRIHSLRGTLREKTRQVKRLTQENDALAQENQQNELKIIMAGFGKGQTEREEERLREEEEARKKRVAAKKAAIQKGALLDDDDDDALLEYYANPDLPRWKLNLRIASRRIYRFYISFQPLAADVFHISSHFGEGIAVYFRFFKWLVLQTAVVAIIVGLLWLAHVTRSLFGGPATELLGFLPIWMQYSSLSQGDEVMYLLTLLSTVVFLVVLTSRKVITEAQRADQDSDLVEQSTGDRIAKYVLSAWDWSINGMRRIEDQQKLIADQLLLFLSEVRDEEARSNRTRSERVIYVLRKVAGNLLMTVVIVAAWTIIILLNLSAQDIINQARTGSIGQVGIQFSQFIVPLAVTAINIILPPLINKVTELERWDNQSFAILMEISRLYAMKALNLLIIVFGYFQLLENTVYISGTEQQAPLEGCIFDKIGLDMFSLYLSDFVLKKLANIGSVYALRAVNQARGIDDDGVREFSVPGSVIDAIYSHTLLLVAFPFFPYVMVLAFVLHLLTFKWEKFMLLNFSRRPKRPWRAKDTGSYFMRFYVVTFALVLSLVYYVLNVVTVDCGLFQGRILITVLDSIMARNGLLDLVYRAVTAPAIIWAFLCAMVVLHSVRRNEVSFLRSFYDDKVNGLRTDILRLNQLIKRQAKRLEDSQALLAAMEEEAEA